LSELVFILPIWLLYGTEQLGLSVGLTITLFMVIWLGSGLLEIPTGALADRLGRKKMYLIGVALLAGYPFVYLLESPVLVILAVSIIAALGSALRSGTLIPIVHDAYKKERRSDNEYHTFLSNEKVLTFVARTVASISGGLLYGHDPHAPYIAMVVVYAAMFAAGFFIVDTAARSELSQFKHIGAAIRNMRDNRLIVMLIGCYVGLQFVAEALWTAFQPFFNADGLSPGTIGAIFSAMAMLSALGSYFIRHLMRRFGVLHIQMIVCVLMTVAAVMTFLPSTTLHVLAVAPIAIAFGMSMVPLIATVQKYVAARYHSTALSVVGLLQYGVYGLGSVFIGFMIDAIGVDGARRLLCIEALAAAVLLAVYFVRHRSEDVVIGANAAERDTLLSESPAA
jgi:MFS family permease